jgi:hypothetical protein
MERTPGARCATRGATSVAGPVPGPHIHGAEAMDAPGVMGFPRHLVALGAMLNAVYTTG